MGMQTQGLGSGHGKVGRRSSRGCCVCRGPLRTPRLRLGRPFSGAAEFVSRGRAPWDLKRLCALDLTMPFPEHTDAAEKPSGASRRTSSSHS